MGPMYDLLRNEDTVVRSKRKRALDLFFACFFIFLAAPFWVLIPILIKFSSPGPVFYTSERVGRGGRAIRCLKFRSMFVDADAKLQELLDQDPEKKKQWQEHQKLKKDPRITPIGRFLRSTSLDELPQFFNVLMGDLSIVGPRPITYNEHLKINQDARSMILKYKPGVTGLWQTSGRSDLNWKERIELEVLYTKKRSLFFDLFLILKTIPAMLSRTGAY